MDLYSISQIICLNACIDTVNFYVVAALGAIVLHPVFYDTSTEPTGSGVGKKRKRKSLKVSPTMKHINASLLKDAQDMIMKGLTRCGEFKPGISPVLAARKLRKCLDSMHGVNKGLIPLVMHTRYFKQ